MALLDISIYPAEPLRTRSEPVVEIDDEVLRLVEDMAETMYAAPGVGLAANKVGIARRVIVVDVDHPDGEPNLIALINPEIVERSGQIQWEEGCLSFPGVHVDVDRSAEVKVRGLAPDGTPVELEAEGLLAVALQHEVDHLDGLLILDRVGSASDLHPRKVYR